MASMRRRVVSQRAVDYTRDRLWLARGLEHALREAVASQQWEAWTCAPAVTAHERLEDFARAGVDSTGAGATAALREVAALISARSLTVWLVPDPLARPGDPFLDSLDFPHLDVDDAVYYVERHGRPENVAAAWQAASSASGRIGIATSLPDAARASKADMWQAGIGAQLIVVEAYDGEGALCLSRIADDA